MIMLGPEQKCFQTLMEGRRITLAVLSRSSLTEVDREGKAEDRPRRHFLSPASTGNETYDKSHVDVGTER